MIRTPGCPDDLVVLESSRPLTELERERLQAHLAVCPTCRELKCTRAAVLALDAVSDGREQAIAARVVAAVLRSPVARPRRPIPARAALIALAGVLLGGAATAGLMAARQPHVRRAPAPSSEVTRPEPVRAHRRSAARGRAVEGAPASAPPDAPTGGAVARVTSAGTRVATPAPDVVTLRSLERSPREPPAERGRGFRSAQTPPPARGDTGAAPAPSLAAAAAPAPIAPPRASAAAETASLPAAAIEAPPEPPAPVTRPGAQTSAAPPPLAPSVPSPDQLLTQANAARARGRMGEAIAAYRRLQQLHPRSEEALVSLVSLGRLLLTRGDPVGALAAFRAYERAAPAGLLAPEALEGQAEALTASGHAADARAVWQRLHASFAGTASAARAADRLRSGP